MGRRGKESLLKESLLHLVDDLQSVRPGGERRNRRGLREAATYAQVDYAPK
jgi:hypothetical protein